MSKKPNVSLFQVQNQPYLYLSVDAKQKNGNDYLFLIDKEYGGINSASIPGIDLNCAFNSENCKQLHSNEFLIGAYYSTNKDKKQNLILCTANTQKSSSASLKSTTINILNHIVYKIDQISFYNVSKNTTSTIRRPDLYFSPEFDLTMQFPYNDNTVGYNKVLDNNNKFCWNKELIRPFSKFYGNPCIILLQGNVDLLFDGEPELIFISKFIQNNPFNLNLDRKDEKIIFDNEFECQCELIFPPLGKFSLSSHSWMIVKTKQKEKKYFHKLNMESISFDISNKFIKDSLFDQYNEFNDEYSHLFIFPFDLLYSDYDPNVNNQNQQKKIFYLIGDDLYQLLNSSFLYICRYINDFQCYSDVNQRLISAGTNSKIEIPIKKELIYFFRKSLYHTGNIINKGNIISWKMESEDTEANYFKESNDLYKFIKQSKSEKFILDSRHISISYFNPNNNKDLIKVKAHFQDEFIVSQFSIHLKHRDPDQIITMKIVFNENDLNHHIYCPEVPLPNPDVEETYSFNLRKIAKNSHIYPVDFKCFGKFRFVTIHFRNKPQIDIDDFSKMIQENDIKFVVKRPINKKPHFEIINEQETDKISLLENIRIKNDIDIADLRNFEMIRIQNGISNFQKCIYLIENNSNPSIFNFNSYIYKRFNSSNRCPFCDKKLSRTNQIYEENQICPLFISHTENQSNKSFAICDDCSNKYTKDSLFKLSKTNFITNDSIRIFMNHNEKYLLNVNEFIDIPKIEIPYQTEPETLISQNATVYRHSFENCADDDVQHLFSVNSKSSVKFNKKVSILIFFQCKVNMKKISYTKKSNLPISLTVSTTHDGMLINSEENPISFQNEIECSSVELKFDPKEEDHEVTLENIQIFGNFLEPISYNNDRNSFPISTETIQYTQNRVLVDCKSKFDDKFKSVQTIMHTGIVKGYKIQIKKGQKLSSMIIAFFKNDHCEYYRCILLPDKLQKNNDNKVFYIPDEFQGIHDCIKIFYLDKHPCDSVNVKIDTLK